MQNSVSKVMDLENLGSKLHSGKVITEWYLRRHESVAQSVSQWGYYETEKRQSHGFT